MTRTWFIILLLLPLILIGVVLNVEMDFTLQITIFVFACLYVWALHFIRLRFLGFTWKQCIIGFFTGVFGKTWMKVWEEDPKKTSKSKSSLSSL